MKRVIYISLAALLAVMVVSLIFWLVTGEVNIVAPVMGAIIVVLLAIKASKNKNF
ncbi:hypothetical protein ADIWIN_2768 [Winogradskyella psychrotolerans RS-3]|uniref:Uncharacterized protein n=1 Tax=Winogradskyella psychrotolerans RS-3 TaxID=641526 RepID=S7X8B1_9FLAO|nr:hypothetical protein [Winogradskyella psychrotolerans]EPR72268.1 hypothetical protein ADIWIN_2768 [Winogradskyella psychrotolerans RS-3]